MPTIAEVRQQYPQYNDMSDADLAGALHSKFYSDMPRADFDQKIGLAAAPPKQLPVDPVSDTIKATGTSAVKSAIGMADIPRVVANSVDAGKNLVRERLGIPEPFDERFANVGGEYAKQPQLPLTGGGVPGMALSLANRLLPSADQIQSKIEETTGPFYKAQTYPGQWGETVGGFLPAAAGGPGSLMSRLVTQAALPAVASEGAGYLVKGTKAEMPARMAAALIAGPAAARTVAGRAAPAAEDLKQAYRNVVNDPVLKATPVNTAGTSSRIATALEDAGFDRLNSPTAFNRVEHIDTYPAPTAGDLISVRKKLSADSRGVPSPDTAGAGAAKREVDQEISAVSPEFRDANANYAQAKKSDLVTGKIEYAADRAGAANSGQNTANATRQRLADLLNPNNPARRSFAPDEIDQIRQVTGGTRTGNAARYIGNLLGGGGGVGQTAVALGLGGAGGYAAGDTQGAGLGAAAALLAGRGLKHVERASTMRQANKLDELIRSRAPLGQASQSVLTKADMDRLVRAILTTQGAATNAQPNR